MEELKDKTPIPMCLVGGEQGCVLLKETLQIAKMALQQSDEAKDLSQAAMRLAQGADERSGRVLDEIKDLKTYISGGFRRVLSDMSMLRGDLTKTETETHEMKAHISDARQQIKEATKDLDSLTSKQDKLEDHQWDETTAIKNLRLKVAQSKKVNINKTIITTGLAGFIGVVGTILEEMVRHWLGGH